MSSYDIKIPFQDECGEHLLILNIAKEQNNLFYQNIQLQTEIKNGRHYNDLFFHFSNYELKSSILMKNYFSFFQPENYTSLTECVKSLAMTDTYKQSLYNISEYISLKEASTGKNIRSPKLRI